MHGSMGFKQRNLLTTCQREYHLQFYSFTLYHCSLLETVKNGAENWEKCLITTVWRVSISLFSGETVGIRLRFDRVYFRLFFWSISMVVVRMQSCFVYSKVHRGMKLSNVIGDKGMEPSLLCCPNFIFVNFVARECYFRCRSFPITSTDYKASMIQVLCC